MYIWLFENKIWGEKSMQSEWRAWGSIVVIVYILHPTAYLNLPALMLKMRHRYHNLFGKTFQVTSSLMRIRKSLDVTRMDYVCNHDHSAWTSRRNVLGIQRCFTTTSSQWSELAWHTCACICHWNNRKPTNAAPEHDSYEQNSIQNDL